MIFRPLSRLVSRTFDRMRSRRDLADTSISSHRSRCFASFITEVGVLESAVFAHSAKDFDGIRLFSLGYDLASAGRRRSSSI